MQRNIPSVKPKTSIRELLNIQRAPKNFSQPEKVLKTPSKTYDCGNCEYVSMPGGPNCSRCGGIEDREISYVEMLKQKVYNFS
jgi:hypothetical protein